MGASRPDTVTMRSEFMGGQFRRDKQERSVEQENKQTKQSTYGAHDASLACHPVSAARDQLDGVVNRPEEALDGTTAGPALLVSKNHGLRRRQISLIKQTVGNQSYLLSTEVPLIMVEQIDVVVQCLAEHLHVLQHCLQDPYGGQSE